MNVLLKVNIIHCTLIIINIKAAERIRFCYPNILLMAFLVTSRYLFKIVKLYDNLQDQGGCQSHFSF